MPSGMNSMQNYLNRVLHTATKPQLVSATKKTSEYFEYCLRAQIVPERWQHVLVEAIYDVMADERKQAKPADGVDRDFDSRNYRRQYERFYIAK